MVKLNRHFPLFDQFFPNFIDSDRFLDEDFMDGNRWIPAINVKESKEHFIIEVSAPGFSKNDFDITITDEILTISAEKEKINEKEKGEFLRKEFQYNSFMRSFTLPKVIDLGKKIKAKYNNGILVVPLVKLDVLETEDHRKKIEIA